MTIPPTNDSLREGGLTLNSDLNLCWDKGVPSHSVGCWFQCPTSVTISMAIITTSAETGQGAQGGPGCPIPSTVTRGKTLGTSEEGGHPGGFPMDEVTCFLMKSKEMVGNEAGASVGEYGEQIIISRTNLEQ